MFEGRLTIVNAPVVELADTQRLGRCFALRIGGSNPPGRTICVG